MSEPLHAAGDPARQDCVERFVNAPGARLRVRMAGAGPVLVLVHGWALDLEMWTPQFDALADAYHLVAFDRRGFGLSTGAPSLERDVEDLRLLLDLLRIERAAVVGMSQGARVALRFALGASARTTCLILDGAPAMSSTHSSELPLEHFRELVRRDGVEAFRSVWRRHPFTQLRTRDASARALVARMIDRYRGADLQTAEQTLPATNVIDLKRLQTPTLLVNGALDSKARLTAADELARGLPCAATVRIAGAAHLPNLDQAHSYNEALRAFLQRCAVDLDSGSE